MQCLYICYYVRAGIPIHGHINMIYYIVHDVYINYEMHWVQKWSTRWLVAGKCDSHWCCTKVFSVVLFYIGQHTDMHNKLMSLFFVSKYTVRTIGPDMIDESVEWKTPMRKVWYLKPSQLKPITCRYLTLQSALDKQTTDWLAQNQSWLGIRLM